MNKPPIKSEPPLNLSIAERETLLAVHQAAATDTRLSPLSQATATKRVQQLRWIQHQRIQQLCAALGANCERPAVHRADGPASEHEVAIDGAWDILISSTAKKLGWDGEPTSRAMNRAAYVMPTGDDRTELYRMSGLIKALEDHRPSPLGDGITPIKGESEIRGGGAGQGTADPAAESVTSFMPKDRPDDEPTLEVDKARDATIAAAAKKLGWEGEPTSSAMFAMPEGPAKADLTRQAGLINAREELRVTPLSRPQCPW